MNSAIPESDADDRAGTVFSLDPASGVPIYRQIIRQVERAVLSGRLRCGDRLPTIRALAVELKANPNTIARAYGELEIRGILTKQVGSGSFISDKRPEEPETARNGKIAGVIESFLREMRELGVPSDEIAGLVEERIAKEEGAV